jgi:hypothetical protein
MKTLNCKKVKAVSPITNLNVVLKKSKASFYPVLSKYLIPDTKY